MTQHPSPSIRHQPIQQPDRIDILDSLRGFAVFGILAVNIAGFAYPMFKNKGSFPKFTDDAFSPEMLPWYDTLAQNLIRWLADGKFYTIFSFLFGLGFSVQMARAEAKGTDIRSFYPRRLMVLLIIGILHSFLWWGDILRVYALLGFLLLAFRTCSNRTVLGWAGFFFAFSFVTNHLPIMGDEKNGFLLTLIGQGPMVMTLFLLGLLIGRTQLFEQLPKHRSLLKMVFGGGIIGAILSIFLQERIFPQDNPTLTISLITTLGSLVLSAAYVSGLSLLSLQPKGVTLLRPLGKVGQMALSNYVLQSIICTLVFRVAGLTTADAGLLGLTIVIYTFQIPLSVWWLQQFKYGPLEWVWRSLTYGKRQPFRRLMQRGDAQSTIV